MSEHVKIYTVNGAPAGSSVALPDWLARARAVKGKGAKRATKDRVNNSLELIQGFEFPEVCPQGTMESIELTKMV